MASEDTKPADTEVATTEESANGVQLKQVRMLFQRIMQEIESNSPQNVIRFVVDFLCKNYPNHLPGFSTIFNGDVELEFERLSVIDFFKQQKVTTEVATHFTNAGYDTLEALTSIGPQDLDRIEQLNMETLSLPGWLPGHRTRLNQIFGDIAGRIKVFREEKEMALRGSQVPSMTAGSYAAPPNPQFFTGPRIQSNASLKNPLQLTNAPYRYPVLPGNILPPQYVQH